MSQTVDRAVAILERLADGPASLADVAGQLGVHKSTALRLLQSLQQAGFARRTESGRYVIGAGLIGIAFQALDGLDVRETARPHLIRLNEMYGHTVHLADYADGDITYIDKYEGRATIRMYSRIGKAAALHASAVGKTILAYLQPAQLDAVIPRITFTRYTAQTITSEHQLRTELAEIRAEGFARDRGEFEDIINCIAAPIHSGDGTVRSAISISVPTALLPPAELERLVPDLLATVRAISAEMGWSRDRSSPGPRAAS
jgi:DNA-binding IclR family transcriptional regulator